MENSTNAIALLKEQHREVESLFEQFEKAEDNDEKISLFQEIADNLAAHAKIEEAIFYPAAYGDQTKSLLTEAVEEHLSAKRLIADLLEMSPDHENFDAKVKVLQEQIEHHVKEEEEEMFKKVQKTMSTEQLETLGAMMEEMFDKALDGDPSENVPLETAEAARLH